MKRLSVGRWSGQLLTPRTRPCCLRQMQAAESTTSRQTRSQFSSAAPYEPDLIMEDMDGNRIPTSSSKHPSSHYASPVPEAAIHSAKLAALHARLSLPKQLPLQTMARTLVHPSADPNINFNNASLARLGGTIISYHVSEFLICTYPRLPISVLFAATYAYNGPQTLQIIAQEWGVETAAAPGSEVDPGYLQFSKLRPGQKIALAEGGSVRPDKKEFMRRGITSRIVYDDEFGDKVPKKVDETAALPTEAAYSDFVKAVVGAVYLHAGREAAKKFVKDHILSRNLQMSTLLKFKEPLRELNRLCAREEFEPPVARILVESGRRTRTPVFVVGIYSGTDKLGEGSGSSLLEARIRASVAALKSWYLYSPGNDVPVPSDTEGANPKLWVAPHIDRGEIVH